MAVGLGTCIAPIPVEAASVAADALEEEHGGGLEGFEVQGDEALLDGAVFSVEGEAEDVLGSAHGVHEHDSAERLVPSPDADLDLVVGALRQVVAGVPVVPDNGLQDLEGPIGHNLKRLQRGVRHAGTMGRVLKRLAVAIEGFTEGSRTLGAVVRFPDVVRAPPERVWSAIVDPAVRRDGSPIYTEAVVEKGRPGAIGTISLYRTKRAAWHEVLLESERPVRALFEVREAAKGTLMGAHRWELQSIQVGTMVVLDVRARNLWEVFLNRYVRRWFYRKLVDSVKWAVEAKPTSVVDQPAPAPPPETVPEPPPMPAAEPDPRPAAPARKVRPKKKK